MANKGDKLTSDAELTVALLKEKLIVISGITSKKMFGGFGVFHEGKMFALVNSHGMVYLKSDESTKERFDDFNAHQHGKMPYFSLPNEIFDDQEQLLSWAQKAITISK